MLAESIIDEGIQAFQTTQTHAEIIRQQPRAVTQYGQDGDYGIRGSELFGPKDEQVGWDEAEQSLRYEEEANNQSIRQGHGVFCEVKSDAGGKVLKHGQTQQHQCHDAGEFERYATEKFIKSFAVVEKVVPPDVPPHKFAVN